MSLYGSYVYNRDTILKSEITLNFHNQGLEEITSFSTYTIKYNEIYQLKLMKSLLLIYLSPARVILIPKNADYNIKELYSELKKLKENK